MACVWEVIENNIQSFHKHNNHSDECCSCWTDYPSVAGLTKRRIILYSSHLPHKTTFPYLWSTDPEPLWKTELTCYHWMSSSFIPLLFFFLSYPSFPPSFIVWTCCIIYFIFCVYSCFFFCDIILPIESTSIFYYSQRRFLNIHILFMYTIFCL